MQGSSLSRGSAQYTYTNTWGLMKSELSFRTASEERRVSQLPLLLKVNPQVLPSITTALCICLIYGLSSEAWHGPVGGDGWTLTCGCVGMGAGVSVGVGVGVRVRD